MRRSRVAHLSGDRRGRRHVGRRVPGPCDGSDRSFQDEPSIRKPLIPPARLSTSAASRGIPALRPLAHRAAEVQVRLLPRDASDDVRGDRGGLAAAGLVGERSARRRGSPSGPTCVADLNRRLTAIFPEERLFRIDHFLGKEPVQDIMYLGCERPFRATLEPRARRVRSRSRWQKTSASRIAARSTIRSARYATSSDHLLQVLALVRWSASGDQDAIPRTRRTPSVRCRRSIRRSGMGPVHRL